MNKVKEIVDGLLNTESAIQITTDGEITEVKPSDEKIFTLKEFYKHTNCDIVEFVYLPNDKIIVCDEEGRLRQNPKINLLATLIVSHLSKKFVPICGDVLIINQNQTE
jgi:hypothetical protein